MDATDETAWLRERFSLPSGRIYLDGNSLGALPCATASRVAEVVERQWGEDLIAGWNRHGWMEAPQRVGDKIGRLIGAPAGSVIVGDTTTLQIFRLLGAVVQARRDRPVIAIERSNFPADNYIAQGLAELLGGAVELRPVDVDDLDHLERVLDERVAVLELSHVDFRSGRIRPMRAIQAVAQRVGVYTCWDLAHSAGALPVALEAAGVELAVGCGYKYLCGGPGAPAFAYVRPDLQDQLRSPTAGWLGHAEPFAFEPDFRPAAGIRGWLCGTPSVLATAALEVGVDLLLEADLEALRAKATALTSLFIEQVEARAEGLLGLRLASPRHDEHRGNQVLWRHPEGYAVVQALIDRGVVGDFRAPDGMRFGFAPAYVRHVDAFDAALALVDVLQNETWRRPEYRRRQAVT